MDRPQLGGAHLFLLLLLVGLAVLLLGALGSCGSAESVLQDQVILTMPLLFFVVLLAVSQDRIIFIFILQLQTLQSFVLIGLNFLGVLLHENQEGVLVYAVEIGVRIVVVVLRRLIIIWILKVLYSEVPLVHLVNGIVFDHNMAQSVAFGLHEFHQLVLLISIDG